MHLNHAYIQQTHQGQSNVTILIESEGPIINQPLMFKIQGNSHQAEHTSTELSRTKHRTSCNQIILACSPGRPGWCSRKETKY